MRGFIHFILQLVAVVVMVFIITTIWIIVDGLNDVGDKADVGLAISRVAAAPSVSDVQLDHVVDLYKDGRFSTVIVVGPTWHVSGNEDAVVMVKYLEDHGVPSKAIISDNRGETMQEMARHVAEIMKSHEFESVMIVADYYQMTRAKLSLGHEGVYEIEKAHVGTLQKEDAENIGREVLALYDYIGKVYLLPAAEQAQKEAKVGMDKASVDADEAKDKVNKTLDSLPK